MDGGFRAIACLPFHLQEAKRFDRLTQENPINSSEGSNYKSLDMSAAQVAEGIWLMAEYVKPVELEVQCSLVCSRILCAIPLQDVGLRLKGLRG